MDLDKLAKSVVQSAKDYIDARLGVFPIATLVKEAIDSNPDLKGADGTSVTVDEVKPLVQEAVNAIEIPTPKDGEPGKDVDMVAVKSMIDEAVRQAVEGIELPTPKDGEDGKSALQIEILPTIDENKSYNRGTYATYRGGLWRSFEKTKGMRGWEVLVDGVADIDINYDGERAVSVKTVKASGEIVEKNFSIPSMIYKEVYREGVDYKQGDAVTYAGSVFVALEDTSDKPATGSKAWRLAVKAGRNANDKVKITTQQTGSKK